MIAVTSGMVPVWNPKRLGKRNQHWQETNYVSHLTLHVGIFTFSVLSPANEESGAVSSGEERLHCSGELQWESSD